MSNRTNNISGNRHAPFARHDDDERIRQPPPAARARVKPEVQRQATFQDRKSEYDAFDQYFDEADTSAARDRDSGVGAVGFGMLNADVSDDDDEEAPQPQPRRQPVQYPPPQQQSLRSAQPAPPRQDPSRSPPQQSRPPPSQSPAQSRTRPTQPRTPPAQSRTPPAQPRTPPAQSRTLPAQSRSPPMRERTQYPPGPQQRMLEPLAPPPPALSPPPPGPIRSAPVQVAGPMPHKLAPPPAIATPAAPASPIAPVFIIPAVAEKKEGPVVSFGVGARAQKPIASGTNRMTMFGDDFWARVSKASRDQDKRKSSVWLHENRTSSRSMRWCVGIIGVILLIAIAGGIGIAWYLTHNKVAIAPTAIGGSANENSLSTVAPPSTVASPSPSSTTRRNPARAEPGAFLDDVVPTGLHRRQHRRRPQSLS